MITFEDYKQMYKWGWIDNSLLKKLVTNGKITAEEYKLIIS